MNNVLDSTVDASSVSARRPRRLVLLAVGLVAVAAAAALIGPKLLAPNAPPPAADDRANLVGGPPPGAAAADSGSFDILRRVITVGATPGLAAYQYTTAKYWQTVTLQDRNRYFFLEVRVYPRNHAGMFFAPQGRVDPTAGTPATPVGAAPASWLTGDQKTYQWSAQRLAWQWGDGNWAFVSASSTDERGARPKVTDEALRALAHQVADALRLDAAGTAVTMPFTMATPAGLRLRSTDLIRDRRADGSPILRASLAFTEGADSQNPDIGTPDAGRVATVTAALGANPQEKPGSVNRTVDGHPVVDLGGQAVFYNAGEGYAVEASAATNALDLAGSVHILPGAANESAWTTQPTT